MSPMMRWWYTLWCHTQLSGNVHSLPLFTNSTRCVMPLFGITRMSSLEMTNTWVDVHECLLRRYSDCWLFLDTFTNRIFILLAVCGFFFLPSGGSSNSVSPLRGAQTDHLEGWEAWENNLGSLRSGYIGI